MTAPDPAPAPLSSAIGPRERGLLVLFLALGAAYFGLLLAERVLAVVGGFSSILLILFLAWLLAFVMSPLVSAIQSRVNLPRPAVVGLVYLVALVALGFLLFYTGAAITQQVAELAANYPETEEQIVATLTAWQTNLDLGRLEIDFVRLYRTSVEQVGELGTTLVSSAQALAGVTVAALGSLLLVVILSLYMVMDSERLLGRLRRAVPKRYSDEADILERSVARAFGGFLRAQLIMALMQAALVAIVGLVFAIPYLFLVGAVSAILMLIPFFGPPLALVPPIAATLIFNPGAALPVAIILIGVQTVAVNWLQPRLMQGALGLHPILVLVGLLLGAQVAGVWGALFGIPVIAVIYVFASYILFRAVPNAALPESEHLDHVEEHTLVAVEKEQLEDETHPHIHVTRTRRPDGGEDVSLDVDGERGPGSGGRTEERDATA